MPEKVRLKLSKEEFKKRFKEEIEIVERKLRSLAIKIVTRGRK